MNSFHQTVVNNITAVATSKEYNDQIRRNNIKMLSDTIQALVENHFNANDLDVLISDLESLKEVMEDKEEEQLNQDQEEYISNLNI